ncbi:DUF2851 family protein [soil metagenome]
MQESFLHFIWQFQYFSKKDLTTSDGESINIVSPGVLNKDAGPDFSDTKILIGNVRWFGHTEIHIHSSDWAKHFHDEDPAYENVILHVVWKDDSQVKRKDGTLIPTLELKERIEHSLIINWQKLLRSDNTIPCAQQIHQVKDLVKLSMMDKALFERLQRKANLILKKLEANQNDWEETTYQLLAGNFGFKINSDFFLELSKALPLKIVLKHQDNIFQIEALIFGQAGFLSEGPDGIEEDNYFLSLQKEYLFLKHKYKLESFILQQHWKFLRLRPANFPTIRLAQLSMLLHKTGAIFSFIKEMEDPKQIIPKLSVLQSSYWCKHYNFNNISNGKIPGIGKSSVENIIINTVVPVLAAYGMYRQEQMYIDRSIGLLQEVASEENKIINFWKSAGIKASTAFDSQALIELYNNYCQQKKCLSCNIGTTLVKTSKN